MPSIQKLVTPSGTFHADDVVSASCWAKAEIKEANGCKSATFCHNNLFLCGAQNKKTQSI